MTVTDPTTQPDPRRWGTEHRSGKFQRVYWDANLAARRQNAWTNVDRSERFCPDDVRADATVPARADGLPFDARDRIERTLRTYDGHTIPEVAHRIMLALTDRSGSGSQVGDQHGD